MTLLDGLKLEEFDHLIEQFIEREDPNAMSFEALGQAARLQLAEAASAQVESADTRKRLMDDDGEAVDPESM